MARSPAPLDPSEDAAGLLRRIGFAVLMLILPTAALVTRRGIVVLVPIGVALLVAASALDGKLRPTRIGAQRLLTSPGFLAMTFAFAWAAVSLAWTPLPRPSADRLFALVGAPVITLGAYFALPERMRSADLYLLPVGVLLAAIAVFVLWLWGILGVLDAGEDGRNLERGLSVLVLFTWPSIAWLRSRARDIAAIVIVVGACIATLIAPPSFASVALSIGAVAYVLATLLGRGAGLAVAVLMATIVILAPAIPLAVLATLGDPGLAAPPWHQAIQDWGHVVSRDPARLLTGHGFGALLRARLDGLVPSATPDVAILQVWYDLGIIGAVASSIALWAGAAGAAKSYAPLLPGIIATFASAFGMACLGVGAEQAWWPAALATVGLLFVAEDRGQFRTRRPRADANG